MTDITCLPACGPNVAAALPDASPAIVPPAIAPPAGSPGADCTTPVFVKVCDQDRFDTALLCTPGTNLPVVVTTTYSSTGLPTSAAYNLDGTAYAGAIGALVSCGGGSNESDPVIWCQTLGVAPNQTRANLTQWVLKNNGVPTGVTYWTDFAGAVVAAPASDTVVQGSCDASLVNPLMVQVYQNCATIPKAEFRTSNIVNNGDFEQSSGTGASSVLGPYITAIGGMVASDDVRNINGAYAIFNGPSGIFTGGEFSIQSRSGNSVVFHTNGSGSGVFQWPNISLINGRTYVVGLDIAYTLVFGTVGIVSELDTFSPIAVFATPQFEDFWETQEQVFVWNGPTGTGSIFFGQTGADPVNVGDPLPLLALDNIYIREVVPAQAGAPKTITHDQAVLATIDQVVFTTGCNDDRRDELLVEIINVVGASASASASTSVDVNPLIIPTIVRQVDAGAQTVATGARSISIMVVAGNPTVVIGAGAAVALAPGMSLTWGVEKGGPAGEALSQAFTFTGIAGDDFIVTTTRE